MKYTDGFGAKPACLSATESIVIMVFLSWQLTMELALPYPGACVRLQVLILCTYCRMTPPHLYVNSMIC